MKVFKQIVRSFIYLWTSLKIAIEDCNDKIYDVSAEIDAEVKLKKVSSWGFVEEVEIASAGLSRDKYYENLLIARICLEKGCSENEIIESLSRERTQTEKGGAE